MGSLGIEPRHSGLQPDALPTELRTLSTAYQIRTGDYLLEGQVY